MRRTSTLLTLAAAALLSVGLPLSAGANPAGAAGTPTSSATPTSTVTPTPTGTGTPSTTAPTTTGTTTDGTGRPVVFEDLSWRADRVVDVPAGTDVYYRWKVPDMAYNIYVSATGGDGDVDLAVNPGIPPTGPGGCSSAPGNAEVCPLDLPPAPVFIRLHAKTDAHNVRLRAYFDIGTTTFPGPPSPVALTNGAAVPISGSGGGDHYHDKYFSIDVPQGATNLSITTTGGSGDVDLMTTFGRVPDRHTADCAPMRSGNEETCTFATPQAGTYFVRLHAYHAYDGAVLRATYTPAGGTPPVTDGPGTPGTPGSVTRLTNGVAVTAGGAQGSETFYSIEVPEGATALTIATSGGTGDVDLFTRFGERPTGSAWDCRPYVTGNGESCTVTAPRAGTYFVRLHGYRAYAGVTLRAAFSTKEAGTSLANGVPVTVADADRQNRYFQAVVPAGTKRFTVTTSGGRGDVDLYVRANGMPSDTAFDCRSWNDGNRETCTLTNPKGTVWVRLVAYRAYSGVTLRATWS